MIRHGKAPYLECSTRGDRRFSAFYAVVRGRSIEERYQAAKVFLAEGRVVGDLSWREAKGRRAINQAEVAKLYSDLWDEYISEHPELRTILEAATGLSDMFGQPGHVCQATELWRIRNHEDRNDPRCVRCGEKRSIHSIEPPYDTADCTGFSYI